SPLPQERENRSPAPGETNLRGISAAFCQEESREAPTTKLQPYRYIAGGLGSWRLGFLWSLAFGAWSFFTNVASASEPVPVAPNDDAPFDFVSALFVFMLATFVGLEVIRRVSRLLHTPLMSLTNAISAIAVVGAILVAGPEHPPLIHWLGLVALFASVTNIVSGFLITDRMLKMFKKKKTTQPK